jgi:hypothetical protein
MRLEPLALSEVIMRLETRQKIIIRLKPLALSEIIMRLKTRRKIIMVV